MGANLQLWVGLFLPTYEPRIRLFRLLLYLARIQRLLVFRFELTGPGVKTNHEGPGAFFAPA